MSILKCGKWHVQVQAILLLLTVVNRHFANGNESHCSVIWFWCTVVDLGYLL